MKTPMAPVKYSLFGKLAVHVCCSHPPAVTEPLLFTIVKVNSSIALFYKGMPYTNLIRFCFGTTVEMFRLCSGFAWDHDGDLLGIITSSSSQVTLWDSNTQEKHIVDTGLRDPLTCIIWSKLGQMMAVGTARGNLAIYNHQTTK